jgi:hypothetical protein
VGGFAHLLDGASAVVSADAHHIATAAVAATLAWSGGAKLRRPLPAAWALVDFGAARHVRPRLGSALGLLEVTLAVTLAIGLLAGALITTLATGAAMSLFAVFAATVGRSLTRGASFDCACFGVGSAPISRLTFTRAALLAALSALLALTAGAAGAVPGVTALVATLTAGVAVTATVALAAAVGPLLRWNGNPFGYDDRHFEAWAPK